MTTPEPPSLPGPKINLPERLEPEYANLARISHSPTEFVIDLGHMLPGESAANVSSRIVMTPFSAKLLLRALAENLARYETALGEIKVPGNSLAEKLFRNLHPPDPPKD